VEVTAQQMDSGISGWMLCVTTNIIWKILHSRGDSVIAGWMECVTVIIIWKLLHSKWTVLLHVERSVLE